MASCVLHLKIGRGNKKRYGTLDCGLLAPLLGRPPTKGAILNFTNILTELKSELTRIDKAIAAITSLNSTHHDRGRRAAQTSAPKRHGRSRMSAAARARLSRLLKQRWAQGKMGKKASAKSARPSKRRISVAGRKRIAVATKRRWAEWRRMQKKPVAKALSDN
jgi:hypothetical protein